MQGIAYSLLFLLPACIGCLQCGVSEAFRRPLTDSAIANASRMLTDDAALRALASYLDRSSSVDFNPLPYFISLGANFYAYAAIVFFSVRIWLRLRSSMAVIANDPRAREVNKQMNRVLAAQALVPLVFSVAPPVFVEVIGLARIASVGYGTQALMSLLLNLQPVVNGLVTMLLVRPYRVAIAGLVCGQWGGSAEKQTAGGRVAVVSLATRSRVG